MTIAERVKAQSAGCQAVSFELGSAVTLKVEGGKTIAGTVTTETGQMSQATRKL